MGLRKRSYLGEANPRRDQAVRSMAEKFYEDLRRFLEKRSDELMPHRMGFSVHAMEFWSNKKRARNLGVIFTPSQGARKGGIGHAGQLVVLVLPIMKGHADTRDLATRLNKDVVVHEMVHFLDPGFEKDSAAAKLHSSGAASYFNSPGEWNAYWQEGAGLATRMLRNMQKMGSSDTRKRAIKKIFGSTVSEFRGKASRFWDKDFVAAMRKKTSRKFDKRLAQLWAGFKKEGWV